MDLERLDEALRFWGATDFSATAKTGGLRLDGDQVLDFGVIYDAARAYRDLLANGERVEPTDEWFVRLANGIERMLKGMPIDRPFMEQQLRELRALVDYPTEEEC